MNEISLYNDQNNARALIGQSAMVNLPVNSWKNRSSSELLYKSNRPQVSMVYRLINHLGCWISETLENFDKFDEFFSCSTDIPRGLSAYKPYWETCGLLLKYTNGRAYITWRVHFQFSCEVPVDFSASFFLQFRRCEVWLSCQRHHPSYVPCRNVLIMHRRQQNCTSGIHRHPRRTEKGCYPIRF